MRLVALAGGTGAAKLLRGLDTLLERGAMTVVGNTRADAEAWGLQASPYLDTACYTLGGLLNEDSGAWHPVISCPSNPVTSAGPILAVPGIVEAIPGTRAPVFAISPIVGGRAVSGPAGRLMAARGLPVSALGIAQGYAPWLDILIIDDEDASLAPSIEAAGARPVVASTLMTGRVEEMRLARPILETLA